MGFHEMSGAAAACISGALGAVTFILCIPVLILLTEVLAALWKRDRHLKVCPGGHSLAVIVPAHNEGQRMLPTLADVLAQIGQGNRLLVVADNCSDDTAEVARLAGAEVIERRDEQNRGKGHALDYGIRHLSAAAPEVVIMVDADCRLADGAMDILAERAFATGRPVQALYLMNAPAESSLNDRVSEFTWRVKNWVRPLGLSNLRLPCQLVGTGMAFPWATLRSADLATGALTEDLKLGIDLAMRGHFPLFCPSALVTSHFAASSQGRLTQQQRWEQGHQDLIRSMVPRLISSAIAQRSMRLLAMALDLAVPPLFLLALKLFAIVAIAASAAASGLSSIPLYIGLAAVAALILSMVLAWCGHGRDVLPAKSLMSIIPYVYAKLRHHIRILAGGRATTWVRTDRS